MCGLWTRGREVASLNIVLGAFRLLPPKAALLELTEFRSSIASPYTPTSLAPASNLPCPTSYQKEIPQISSIFYPLAPVRSQSDLHESSYQGLYRSTSASFASLFPAAVYNSKITMPKSAEQFNSPLNSTVVGLACDLDVVHAQDEEQENSQRGKFSSKCKREDSWTEVRRKGHAQLEIPTTVSVKNHQVGALRSTGVDVSEQVMMYACNERMIRILRQKEVSRCNLSSAHSHNRPPPTNIDSFQAEAQSHLALPNRRGFPNFHIVYGNAVYSNEYPEKSYTQGLQASLAELRAWVSDIEDAMKARLRMIDQYSTLVLASLSKRRRKTQRKPLNKARQHYLVNIMPRVQSQLCNVRDLKREKPDVWKQCFMEAEKSCIGIFGDFSRRTYDIMRDFDSWPFVSDDE